MDAQQKKKKKKRRTVSAGGLVIETLGYRSSHIDTAKAHKNLEKEPVLHGTDEENELETVVNDKTGQDLWRFGGFFWPRPCID